MTMAADQIEEVNSLICQKDTQENDSDITEQKHTFILQDNCRSELKNHIRHGTQPDQGWAWIVMAASFGAHVVNGGFLYSIGIIHNALLKQFDASYTLTSWIGSMFIGLMASAGPIASYLINRYSCRVTTMVGGILMSAGCLVSAFMNSINMVMLMFGFISGVGAGLTYTASVVVVGLNFQKKLNIATGIAVSGSGVGTFIFPSILTLAELNYGYQGLFMVLASIALQQCLFGAMFRPSYTEKKNKDEKCNATTNDAETQRKRRLSSYLQVLRNKSIMALCISSLGNSTGVYLVVLHLPNYVISRDTSPLNAAFLLTIAGICLCGSRLMTGFLGNLECVPEILLYCSSLGILGICTLLFPLYSSTYYGQVIYAVILGMFSGNCYSIYNSINIQLVGESNLAIAYGIEIFFIGVGTTIGPLLAGVIVDGGGTYEQSFLCAGSAILSGSIVGIFAKCWNTTKKEEYFIDYEASVNTKKSNKNTSQH